MKFKVGDKVTILEGEYYNYTGVVIEIIDCVALVKINCYDEYELKIYSFSDLVGWE